MSAPSAKPRFELGWYNGWSPDERRATLPIQREAIRTGQLARPMTCSICGSGEDVWLHDERYDRPLEAYPVCRPCHRALHNRFDAPAPWLKIVVTHGGRDAWFELLSLDPISKCEPFERTYPAGLPAATTSIREPFALQIRGEPPAVCSVQAATNVASSA